LWDAWNTESFYLGFDTTMVSISFVSYTGSVSQGSIGASLSGSVAGDWHHVVITWESGSRAIYLDGVLAASSVTYAAPSISSTSLYLGYVTERFGGAIAELATFSRVLTADEVAWLYAAAQPLADSLAHLQPVETLGPNHASWHILYGSASESSTSYTDIDHTEFGWGGPVSGRLQLEALMKGSTPSTTAYAILEWYDSGTWREVSQSEISVTGTTESLARSAVFSLSPDERLYRLSLKSDTGSSVSLYRAALICTPGGLSEL